MIKPGLLRAKLLCAEYGQYLVATLVLASLFAMVGAGAAVVNPPTTTVTESTHTQTVATTANTSAHVVEDTPLWPAGTTIEDPSFYPLPGAPTLAVDARTTVPEGTAVEVSHSLSVIYRVNDDGRTIWRKERVLTTSNETVEDGEASLNATVDVSGLAREQAALNEELTGIGRAQVLLRLDTRYDSGRYADELASTVPLWIGDNGYRIEGSFSDEQVHSTTVERTVPQDNTGRVLGFLLVALAATLGALGAHRIDTDDVDPEDIIGQIERARHQEWISEGRLRHRLDDGDIEMRSLSDLVDVAIDCDRRVVHDPVRDLYAVVDRDTICYYVPSDDWGEFVFQPTPTLEPGPVNSTPATDGGNIGPGRTEGHDPWADLLDVEEVIVEDPVEDPRTDEDATGEPKATGDHTGELDTGEDPIDELLAEYEDQ